MSYSRSLATANRAWQYVQPLLSLPPQYTWQTTASEAGKLAYKIREAFYIARLHPTDLPKLAAVADRYIINVSGGRVTATLDDPYEFNQALAGHLEKVAPARVSTKVFPVAFSVDQVIQTWLDSYPCQGIDFIKCDLSPAEQEEITNWAGNLEPSWAVKFNPGLILRLSGVSR